MAGLLLPAFRFDSDSSLQIDVDVLSRLRASSVLSRNRIDEILRTTLGI